MAITSRNQSLKVFPAITIIIGENLKSEFKKILPFDCCRNVLCTLCKSTQQMSDTIFANEIYLILLNVFYLFLYRNIKSHGIFKV